MSLSLHAHVFTFTQVHSDILFFPPFLVYLETNDEISDSLKRCVQKLFGIKAHEQIDQNFVNFLTFFFPLLCPKVSVSRT